MIQRYLFTALKNGIDQINADPEIITDLFTNFDLTTTEIEAIKTWFAATPPEVHHGYARVDTKFPSYHIILGSENESDHVLGDEGVMIDDPEDENFGADVKTTIWEHNYQVLCYAEHPDATTYMYEIAKTILIVNAHSFFTEAGLFFQYISGMDLAPDPRYLPENLFGRQLTFKCKREFCRVDKDSAAGKAFQVSAIHVDKSGSPSDVGGVKTKVTLFYPQQEASDDGA